MKLSSKQLQKIIKEQLENIMTEMEEESPGMMVDREMDELPDAGGSIMGSPGAMARDELMDIADALDDAEYLSQLAKKVQSDEAKRVLEKLGYM